MSDSQDQKVAERLARIEEGLGYLIDQMTPIRAMSESIARMQERADQHGESIEILFKKVGESNSWISKVDGKVEKWINRGVGGYAVAALLAGVMVWFLTRSIGEYDAKIRQAGDMIITIDRRLTWTEFELKGRAATLEKANGPVR